MANKQCSVLLSVHPSRALVDEKFKVLVQNASPGAELTVHSHLLSEDKHNWEAFGHYICDSTGSVNLCEDLSLGGTYEGVEPMGLLWSLRPVPGSKPGLRLRKSNVETPLKVTVSVYQGHLTEGFPEHRALAAVLVERWYMAPGVQRIPVTEHNLTATLFLPPGPGPFPAVLDLWGGGGNLVEYRSSLLASHGFAALALDYLTNDLTITTGKMMKNDYFETAYKFLEQHPQIVGSRIAMWGLSLGTAMTLKMAAYSKVMKLRCAVCYSGSHIQPVNGSTEEILNNFLKNQDKTRINEKQEMIWHDLILPIPEDPALKVDMGRVQCPLLLVVGQDDQNWPAFVSAMDIKKMMEKAGNIHLLTLLVYPDTGHLIEPPYSPHTRASTFRSFESRELYTSLWGGQTVGHARAQEDSWRKSLMFLREHLYGRRKKSNL
ncbi:acyl-coenzyme A thioesterase 5-like [Periophthalmus magnuspinnatus]|uniref:acyl-coenzyme A thioesterase 5-like n=1 Tax=Periophthalmus magnuspinnatus TaxID=409849 RepID=UPI00145B60B0|nr:acyl-coenzyme A thioesterase 5-like [Periophthalmus magnuspinnatus]XP_055078317.1 acyl-coenzyme A thioesterase 5-like [Periophthalmus magnuspinnatus]